MIINTTRRFIFVHVPKAAGTSIAAALAPLPGNHTGWLACTKHEPLADFLAAAPGRMTPDERREVHELDSYFCFAFVRNPWERLCSLYRYLIERRPRPEIAGVASFKHFLMLADERTPWVAGLHSMRQQVDFFTTPHRSLRIDYLGHFEHLAEDIQSVASHIGTLLHIPHLNRSSAAVPDYRSLYDAHMVDVVARLFADDVRILDYTFDEPPPRRRVSGPLSCTR